MAGLLEHGRKLDEAVSNRMMKSPRIARMSARQLERIQPKGPALAVWHGLEAEQRREFQTYVLQGRPCEDPHDALICTDLADSAINQQWERIRAAAWGAVLFFFVGSATVLAFSGDLGPFNDFLYAFFIPVGMVGQARNLDKARQQNQQTAREAGLI